MVARASELSGGREPRRVAAFLAALAILGAGSLVGHAGGAGATGRSLGGSGLIAFRRSSHLNDSIALIRSDGTGLHTLVGSSDKYPRSFDTLAWSPDGRKLVFDDLYYDTEGIYVVNADGSGQKKLVDIAFFEGSLAWSPDGKRIALVGGRAVGVMSANGKNQRLLAVLPGGKNGSADAQGAKWSPDGRQILVWKPRDKGEPEIYLVNTDGSGKLVLVTGREPDWSPNGKLIAYAGHDGLYRMNADGSGQRLLLRGPYFLPEWSPDGKQIAFAARDGLHRMNADGSGARLLLRGAFEPDGAPGWSPDGTTLIDVFSTGGTTFDSPGGKTELDLVNSDGSGRKTLFKGEAFNAVWQPHPRGR